MDVAELYDAIALEGWRQISDGDGAVDDDELVSGDFAGVESERCGSGASSYDEVASAKARRLVGLRAGHTS
jgi:hypothetical protein